MSKVYIVRFKDNCIMPLRIKPTKNDFEEGAKIYEVRDSVDLCMLSYWYANSFNLVNFKEIKL